MSKTRVFIWGSCVSRDTFEHLDPEQFELIQYVARQSALSAYSRAVELAAPPVLESRFQQRMITGDFASSLYSLIPQSADATDLLLVDLVDERLGVYLLPDGSVVTRSVELISSGDERVLPEGTQHLPFGTQQHFEYWSAAINAVGERVRTYMPHAAVALLDIPWAEWSESGRPTPESFGVAAAQANSVYRPYVHAAAQALGAHLVSLEPANVRSGAHHPWGEAPFHYAESVYLDAVRSLTGGEGRIVWGPGTGTSSGQRTAATGAHPQVNERRNAPEQRMQPRLTRLQGGPSFLIAGAQRGGTAWLQKQLNQHPEVSVVSGKASEFLCTSARYTDPNATDEYLSLINADLSARLRGERSERYFWKTSSAGFSPTRDDAAEAARDLLDPDAQVLVTLRDPVTRAVSSYWNLISSGKFGTSTSIFQSPAVTGVLDLGFYRRHYEHWAQTFGADRIHVLLHDDLAGDPAGYLKQALKALGLAPSLDFWRENELKKRENHKSWVLPMRKRNPLSREEIAVLLELYRTDISFIEDLVGRKLGAWRDPKKLMQRVNPK